MPNLSAPIPATKTERKAQLQLCKRDRRSIAHEWVDYMPFDVRSRFDDLQERIVALIAADRANA